MPVAKDAPEKLKVFLTARLRAAWRENYDAGAVEAVCARIDSTHLADARVLLSAVSEALKKKGDGSLLEALVPYKRSRNLTAEAEKSISASDLKPEIFAEEAEKALYEKLKAVELLADALVEKKKYQEFLVLIAELGKPLGRFFDEVMVNCPDAALKKNRLALLLKIRGLYERIADFSLVQVD